MKTFILSYKSGNERHINLGVLQANCVEDVSKSLDGTVDYNFHDEYAHICLSKKDFAALPIPARLIAQVLETIEFDWQEWEEVSGTDAKMSDNIVLHLEAFPIIPSQIPLTLDG